MSAPAPETQCLECGKAKAGHFEDAAYPGQLLCYKGGDPHFTFTVARAPEEAAVPTTDADEQLEHAAAHVASVFKLRAVLEVHGITFLLLRDGCVLLEQCPKKAAVLGVGEWFVPGGKLEPGEIPADACRRELREELGVEPYGMRALPILEGSPVPPGPRGLFLMRPYVVDFEGKVPEHTLDGGVPLRWTPIAEALHSPVPQVRMMVAATLGA